MNGKRKFDNGQEQERVPDAHPDEQYKPDMRWKHMILIKRYPHHTLYFKPSLNGNGYHECFLNTEIERAKRFPG